MSDATQLKSRLHACLATANEAGGLDEDNFTILLGLIDELAQVNPYVAAEHPDIVAGSWNTLFASFGARHSSAKTVRHAADLKIHSLGQLPSAPIQVLSIVQEIDEQGDAYNNVVDFECGPDDTSGRLIVRGRFSCDAAAPNRYQVGFHRAEVLPRNGATLDDLCAGLGFRAGEALSAEFQPPPFYSDILFVDEDLRINRGNFGGVYVLARRDGTAYSL